MLEAMLVQSAGGPSGPLLTYDDFLEWVAYGSGAELAPNGGYVSQNNYAMNKRYVAQLNYAGNTGFIGAMTGTPYRGYMNLPNTQLIRVVQHALPPGVVADYLSASRKSVLKFTQQNTREFVSLNRNGFTSAQWFPSFDYLGQMLREFIYWDESLSTAMVYDPFDPVSNPKQFVA